MFGELYDAQKRGNDPTGFAAFFTVMFTMLWLAPVFYALVTLPQLFWNDCFVLPTWLAIAPILVAALLSWVFLRKRDEDPN